MNKYNLETLETEIFDLFKIEWKSYKYYQDKLDYFIDLGLPLSSPQVVRISIQLENHLLKVVELRELLHRRYLVRLKDYESI